MKGTPTIGKAKSLKEKRELAAELGTSSFSFTTTHFPYLMTTSHSHLIFPIVHPDEKYEADKLDDVQEFEAKRGVSDPPEERASRSKDTGRRPSAGTSIGDNDEDEDEEEEQTGPKPKVSPCILMQGLS